MYAIVDIETTGGHASANSITEIAIYLHDGYEITGRYQTLINPERPIPPFIVNLTGITQSMVSEAPLFSEVAEKIHQMLKGRVFVAHNVNFDYSFVRHHLKQAGLDLSEKKLCTIRLSRKLLPGMPSYSLGNLCRSLNIGLNNRHRAAGDALATVRLFELILQKGGQSEINRMLKRSSGEQWLPIHLDKSVIDQLPSGPGVYYFHNTKGKVIYVGKAISVRRRVAGHFTQNDPDPKRQNLIRNVHQVTYQACASELHALVLESAEIRRIWPQYNRSQKKPMQKFGLYSFTDHRGYLRLAIDQYKKSLPSHYTFFWLHEGQVMLRKLVEGFSLSRQLCFLDTAAEEKPISESVQSYNERVREALESLDRQLPTFAVVEEGYIDSGKLYLLVEKGCFWGMGMVSNNLKIDNAGDLKTHLEPYRDNDFIRSNLYNYIELNPSSKLDLKP
jgi:DNA polymerase-3 subunit epsilon